MLKDTSQSLEKKVSEERQRVKILEININVLEEEKTKKY